MDHHNHHVMTLANSIIGVSILAMPYCFKQCGILLAIFILLLTNLISRVSSHFLIKSAIITRRKTFEYLAYYIFGGLGKFAIEIGIIGFLIGTCIAFFVVMGDLGPEIISEITGRDTSSTMRSSILMALALFCVLPLGLLRNIDSLSGVSRATIGFYFCLVLKIIIEALPHIFFGDWFDEVELWRPGGVIQCLPIFSMALSCQTQLFEIYQVVHNPTLERMNSIVKKAVNICTLVYFLVGFFGYIAFAKKSFSGNILISFAPSLLTNAIKLGFILSIAFSFPLVIFPCRASIHSLIYREGFSIHEGVSNYIPEGRFKGLTFIIVFVSLIVGILIPNIELVLGLVGSTIGIIICVLFPVISFITVSQKNTNERVLAKLVLVIGVTLMILGTYKNLYSLEKIESSPVVENLVTEKRELKIINPAAKDINIKTDDLVILKLKNKKENNKTKEDILVKVTNSPEIRHEPPQPIEPQDSQSIPEKPKIKNVLEIEKNENLNKIKDIDNIEVDLLNKDEPVKQSKNVDEKIIKKPEKVEVIVPILKWDKTKTSINESKYDQVDLEAIQKDDKETQLQQKENKNNDPHHEEHKILLDTLQKQNEVQEEIVKQQKKLIEVIEKQQEQVAKEEKLKAVKEIETIALQAIEKISSDVKNNEKIVAELQKNVIQKVNSNEKSAVVNEDAGNVKKKENTKLEEFKIENILLNSKIAKNNLTNRENISDNRESKKNNLNDNDNNKSLEENPILNAKPDITKHNIPDNRTNVPRNVLNKTAPLFLNLGINIRTNNETNQIQNVLPMVKLNTSESKIQTKNVNSVNSLGRLESTIPVVNISNNNNKIMEEEAKVMRRDILAYAFIKKR